MHPEEIEDLENSLIDAESQLYYDRMGEATPYNEEAVTTWGDETGDLGWQDIYTGNEEAAALAAAELAEEAGLAPYVEGSTDALVAGDDAAFGQEAWWRAYQRKRDERQAALWGDDRALGGGAKGIVSYLGGNYNYGYTWAARGHNPDQELAIGLARALKFSRNLGQLAGGDAARAVTWAANENPSPGTLALDPQPIRDLVDATSPLNDQFEANSIVAGQALHDGAHLRHTPADMAARYGDLAYLYRGKGLRKDDAARAGYLIEDAYVEAEVLAEFPGFQDYLASQWRHKQPPEATLTQLQAAAQSWTHETALPLIQDLARRYDELTPTEQQLLAALPEDRRRFLGHARQILDRAHTPKLAPGDRVALAGQLLALLLNGEIPPEDQQPGEDPTVPPPAGGASGAGGLADALRDLQHEGKGHGPDGAAAPAGSLSDSEQTQAAAEGQLDRQTTRNDWPSPPEGARSVELTWITPNPRGDKSSGVPRWVEDGGPLYQKALAAVQPHVKALARALHFRAATPSRQQRAQLRGKLDDKRLAHGAATAHLPGGKRVFKRREILSAPRVGVEVLVDISGSTSKRDSRTGLRRSDYFRQTAVLLDAAFQELDREAAGSVAWQVHAHTDSYYQQSSQESGVYAEGTIYRLIEPGLQDRGRLGLIQPQGGNYDGEVLWAVCKKLEHDWPDRQKLVLFLNDGLPCGVDYGGDEAERRVAEVCRAYRRRGFTIVTLYVGELGGTSRRGDDKIRTSLTTMYGPEGRGWLHVANMADLPRLVAGLVQKELAWKA